jgi:hypothetical protein
MARISITDNISRGKIGAVVCEYRRGTNYARSNPPRIDAKSSLQLLHRARYGQLQKLGSIWNRDFVTPYFQGNRETELPYNKFINYNWRHWDKESPAWESAVPFWGLQQLVPFGTVAFAGSSFSSMPLKIISNIPADPLFSAAELSGFSTHGEPENFVKAAPQSSTGPGWQTFDTGLNAENPLIRLFYISWLQVASSCIPVCMPVNFQVRPEPSCTGWHSFSCGVQFNKNGAVLNIFLVSDIPYTMLTHECSGYVRLWNARGILLTTLKCTPQQGDGGIVAFTVYNLSRLQSSVLCLQAWFENNQAKIPVSKIEPIRYTF